MVEIVWQDPPSRSGGRSADYDLVIESLKAHPGRWALITADWKTSVAPTAFRQQGCETTTRRNKDEKGTAKSWSVYARCPIKAPPVSAAKVQVEKAIATGTALKPPPPVIPRKQASPNDFGLSKFVEDRRARGVPDPAE